MPTAGLRCQACTPLARSRVTACAAPTGLQATLCSRAWCMGAGSASCLRGDGTHRCVTVEVSNRWIVVQTSQPTSSPGCAKRCGAQQARCVRPTRWRRRLWSLAHWPPWVGRHVFRARCWRRRYAVHATLAPTGARMDTCSHHGQSLHRRAINRTALDRRAEIRRPERSALRRPIRLRMEFAVDARQSGHRHCPSN